ncbi:hypothetical protein Sru01_46650 [Sphaerisporangium rufum]|uniref:DUF4352 domain-containing protein n=1 Tax=Sphaerisporangium rufum TaxID=1381558 RepID=A0A919R5K3_9ACTN|nr:hypothetical protein [Sphaerisporangium rufum]GII79683.1 hypothetical protein Sru01_46650 [Sphaerisporangium rufum]
MAVDGMNREDGGDREEPEFDAFAPNPNNTPPGSSTGSWPAFRIAPVPAAPPAGTAPPAAAEPSVFTPATPAAASIPAGTPSASRPEGAGTAGGGSSAFTPATPGAASTPSAFRPGGASTAGGGSPAAVPGAPDAGSPVPETTGAAGSGAGAADVDGARPGPGAGDGRAGRRGRVAGAVRAGLVGVTAVAAVAATVGVQWWDRARWVAERYPAEKVTEVATGSSTVLHGVAWQAGVSTGPPGAGDPAGTVTLRATVRLTPRSAAAAAGYEPPAYRFQDRDGHRWTALQSDGPIRLDLRAGQTASATVVGSVPAAARDSAELVLSYSPGETLRFAR